MQDFQELVGKLKMEPHPEGGFYKETYRSKNDISPESLWPAAAGGRSYSTAIYFLLHGDNFSAFHRIKADEMWHFYGGKTLLLHMIHPSGEYECIRIGSDVLNDEHPQFVVPAGVWFASETEDKSSFSFVGCTVSPGFDFRDFEMPGRDDLIRLFPQHHEVIAKLTRL